MGVCREGLRVERRAARVATVPASPRGSAWNIAVELRHSAYLNSTPGISQLTGHISAPRRVYALFSTGKVHGLPLRISGDPFYYDRHTIHEGAGDLKALHGPPTGLNPQRLTMNRRAAMAAKRARDEADDVMTPVWSKQRGGFAGSFWVTDPAAVKSRVVKSRGCSDRSTPASSCTAPTCSLASGGITCIQATRRAALSIPTLTRHFCVSPKHERCSRRWRWPARGCHIEPTRSSGPWPCGGSWSACMQYGATLSQPRDRRGWSS